MNEGRDTVTVRVPGSTSNCGAGFDTLGLALKIYNRITVSLEPAGLGTRGVTPQRPSDHRAMALVTETVAAFDRTSGGVLAGRGVSFHIEGDVPVARGLGSSATIITGVLAGLNELCGTAWSREQIAAVATALEGNPDNVSPSVLGGFTVSRCDPETGGYGHSLRFSVPADVAFVVVSPAIELFTKESRGALPKTVSHRDAARSVNSAAYVAAVFASGDFARLRGAVGDFLHEPYRLPKIPGAAEAIRAGMASGALTGWLSGSGSSVLCVSWRDTAEIVAGAMRAEFKRVGLACEARILTADNDGLSVE
jgi:homoserine kinase